MEESRHKTGLMAAPKLMLDGLSDFMKKRRTPSMRSKKGQEERKTSAPAGLSQVLPVVGIISMPGTSREVRVFPEYDKMEASTMPRETRRPQTVVAPVAPIARIQGNEDDGRNLLNKKEAGPPSTIKESSESSQTIDDNDSEKGGGQLKHENTVVRADGGVGGSGVVSKTSLPNSNAVAHPALRNDIVRVTQLLVDSIANKDFTTYSRLCDPAVTFIGPETGGQIVEGVEFHRYQFEQHSMNSSGSSSSTRVQSTMLQAHVHAMGDDGASVAYILLTQYTDRDGQPRTRQSQESRVWHKKNGRWVCVHAHRSGGPEAL